MVMFYKETNFKETPIGEIPEDWEFAGFQDLCEKLRSGGTPLTSKKEYYNGDIPFVKIEDITNAKKYLYSTLTTITKEGLNNSTTWLVPENSLILAIYGSLGSVAINTIELATNQAILGIILRGEKAETEFFYYVFSYLNLRKYAKRTTQANLTAEIIKDLKVPLPPLEEQKAIAHVLSSFDEAIQKTNEVIAKTGRLKKGLMQELLTKGIGHKEFRDTEIGKVPKDWKVIRLGDIISSGPQNGLYKHAKYYGDGIPIIRIESFGFGKLMDSSSLKRIRLTKEELETYSLEPRDIILNRVNSIEYIGKSILISELPQPMVFESNMMRFRIDDKIADAKFVVTYLNSDFALASIRSKAKRAVHQASVNQDDVRSIVMHLPPFEEQKRLAEIISSVDKKLEIERNEKAKLERIKQGFMDLLLTGKIRVKVN